MIAQQVSCQRILPVFSFPTANLPLPEVACVEHVAVGEETRPYPTHRIGIQNGTIPIAVLSWSCKFNVALPCVQTAAAAASDVRSVGSFRVVPEASGFGRRSSSASRFDMAFSQPSPLLWYSVRIVFASDCRTAADHSCGGPSTTPAHERHNNVSLSCVFLITTVPSHPWKN